MQKGKNVKHIHTHTHTNSGFGFEAHELMTDASNRADS